MSEVRKSLEGGSSDKRITAKGSAYVGHELMAKVVVVMMMVVVVMVMVMVERGLGVRHDLYAVYA